MKRRYKVLIFGIIILPLTFIIIIWSIFGILLIRNLTFPLKNTNINSYLKTEGYISDFIAFPNDPKENGEIIEYHYYDYRLQNGSEIILIMQYEQIEFEEEVKRIETVRHEGVHSRFEKTIAKDENGVLFNYYTYVCVYDVEDQEYEYVCVDFENRKMAYIHLKYFDLEYVSIDYSYLPRIYLDDNEIYNDYYFEIYENFKDKWF